ncbi:hypothetical protein BaOVIS_009620 [Babesia ovis]|uniref:SNF2 family N-terminal domain containing protein n=1 Tax=Babesia ovis TaxID=5869 RepID=A0A9W5T975_BABOV|nr:hypothetical protein BaOVIS_009620 [Babesia ovis]
MSTDPSSLEIFSIGKHKGRTFEDVYLNEPGYVCWAIQIESPRGQLKRFCEYLQNRSATGASRNSYNSNNTFVNPLDTADDLVSLPTCASTGSAVPKWDSDSGASLYGADSSKGECKNDESHTRSLGNCLDAKWRRLTEKRDEESLVEDQEELRKYRAKRRNTASNESHGSFDDSMTLEKILEVAVSNKQSASTVSGAQKSGNDGSTAQSSGNMRPNRALTLVSGLSDGSRLGGHGVTAHSPGTDIDVLTHNTETKMGDIDAYTCSGKPPLTNTTVKSLVKKNALKAPEASTIPSPGSSTQCYTDVTSTATGEEATVLKLEGVVALVLHTEEEFHVAYQKYNGNNTSSWTNMLPQNLFQFLVNLQAGLRISKEGKQKYVLFHANKYDTVLKSLRKALAKSNCPVDPIPNFILRTFPAFQQYARKVTLHKKTQDAISGVMCDYTQKHLEHLEEFVGEELYSNLKPFQLEGVSFGIRKNGRVMIGDEMGLGKTLQALAISAFYHVNWPLLIVCPSSLRFQWRDQCLRWLPHLIKFEDICTVTSSKNEIADEAKVVIVSYDLYVLNPRFHKGFSMIICDESHYLKNQTSKRTRCLVPQLKEATRTILLSGTPTLNSPCELFEQISCIIPSFCSNSTFVERYCAKRLNWFTKRVGYSGSQHETELHLFLVKTVMIRRLKENVFHELPPKIRSKVPIELPKDFLIQAQRQMVAFNKGGMHKDDEFASSHQLFKLTGEAKIKGIREYIVHMIKSEVKFIIFAHHISVMDAIEKTLRENKCKYMRIDGSTPQSTREENVNMFQNDKQCQVALLSITACGIGLNLTESSTVVFAELHWVPGQMIQAEDRVHRIGTKHRVININYLIAEGSIEETMWRVINRKWEGVTATLNGETSHLAITKEAKKTKICEMVSQHRITEFMA